MCANYLLTRQISSPKKNSGSIEGEMSMQILVIRCFLSAFILLLAICLVSSAVQSLWLDEMIAEQKTRYRLSSKLAIV